MKLTQPHSEERRLVLDLVGDRWSVWLLIELDADSGRRFGELAGCPGLSRRVLAERLKTLSDAGLIAAVEYSVRPPRRYYLLTARGAQLQRILLAFLHVAGGGNLDERAFLGETAPALHTDSHPSDQLLEADPARARAIFDRTLRPLLRYDDQYGTDLVGTLQAYLNSDASISVAAAQLYAHRHTIRYRLGRVNELTGLDVDSISDREQLSLGLRAMRAHSLHA